MGEVLGSLCLPFGMQIQEFFAALRMTTKLRQKQILMGMASKERQ